MGLIGVVLRAVAVSLVTATLLLPIADHHTADRMPEAGVPLRGATSVHEQVLHHHGEDDHELATAAGRSATGPALAPARPLTTGGSVLAPQAVLVATLLPRPSAAAAPAAAVGRIPTSLLEPPPERPPNHTT